MSKEELVQERKRDLEQRLQDVSGQLNNNNKKPQPTKGTCVWGRGWEETGGRDGAGHDAARCGTLRDVK